MSFVKEMTYCVIKKFRMLREETMEQHFLTSKTLFFGVNSTVKMFLTVISSGKGNDMNIPALQLPRTLRSVVLSIRIHLHQ